MADPQTEQAYNHCLRIVRGHYENFPVASLILPRRLRKPIAAIYAFARQADDIADEGDDDATTRLARLDRFSEHLRTINRGEPIDEPVFIALADTIRQFDLPVQLLEDLLIAFRLDVRKTRYENFSEVLAYCRYSANPVGRLLLYMQNASGPVYLRYSDTICTALQLINFLQDMAQDYDENRRIYLPRDEMMRFGVTENHLKNRVTDDKFRRLVHCQIVRARELIHSGKPLGKVLHGRFALQLRLMINGGLAILDALERQQNDAFARPRLTKHDWLAMTLTAVLKR